MQPLHPLRRGHFAVNVPKLSKSHKSPRVMPVMPWIRWPLCLPVSFLCFPSVWATWCQLPKHNSCKGQRHGFAARRFGCPWIDADVEKPYWSPPRKVGDHMAFLDWDKDGYLDVLELYDNRYSVCQTRTSKNMGVGQTKA